MEDLGSHSVGEGLLHVPHGRSQWKRQSLVSNCLLVGQHEKWIPTNSLGETENLLQGRMSRKWKLLAKLSGSLDMSLVTENSVLGLHDHRSFPYVGSTARVPGHEQRGTCCLRYVSTKFPGSQTCSTHHASWHGLLFHRSLCFSSWICPAIHTLRILTSISSAEILLTSFRPYVTGWNNNLLESSSMGILT